MNKIIKNGIKLHILKNDKFKTNIIAIFLTTPLNKEEVTKNALIPAVLRRGTQNLKTQKQISEKLEEMYGADFNCGVEKRGDNQVLKFYIESLNDEYSLQKSENIFKNSVNLLFDIVFNPYRQNNGFDRDYIISEKENLKKIIDGKIDNKSFYAYSRCIEEMYKNKPFGLYEYGFKEYLNKIDEVNLFEYYKQLIARCKIDIVISGNINNEVENEIENIINKLKITERNAKYLNNSIEKVAVIKEKEIKEKMDITQGKLVIGMSSNNEKPNIAAMNIYSTILGEGANSKLFQNVREKASLAYTASSMYIKMKNAIFIRAGIKLENYEKALKIIKEQLDDIKNGKFTENDMAAAKELIIAVLRSILDEQADEISYVMSQELIENKKTVNEYIKEIEKVTMKDVKNVANELQLNTIYFLTNE